MSEQNLDISWRAIIKVFIAGFALYVIFIARDIIIWFFFALIISILLDPAVRFLRRLKLPKVLAVILVYTSMFGILGLMIYLTAPIFIFEIHQLSKDIPGYFEKINPLLGNLGINVAQNFDDFTVNLISGLQDSSASIVKAVAVFFGGISSTVFIFAFAFFISLEDRWVERALSLLLPQKYEGYIVTIFERVQFKVSGWFIARILACIFVGIASFMVFFLLGIKYAFILALLSGILNFVPYIGPTITLVFSTLFVGVSSDWTLAMYILITLLIIQEIENKFLSPMLMKKFIDLSPVLVLMSLLVGGTVFGFLGTVFSVPICGIIYEFLKEFLESKKEESSGIKTLT